MARLTKKERSFCIGFINSGDIDFAERYSGLDNGRELLCREEIRDELRRLSDVFNESVAYTASAGLKKLAMGSVADAVSLLYKEKPDHDVLEKMDLFLVSEIKRKDNCVEIKFFDRLKALEKLSCLPEDSGGVAGLFDAIGRHAASGSEDVD